MKTNSLFNLVTVDSNGIAWFCATGQQGVIAQSRDEADDDRWSGNVTGVARGYEQTMIAKSIGIASDGHFASKLFGGNHSGSGASSQRWYDLGVRSNGDIQLQWEGPHPSNHDFDLPAAKQPIQNIGVSLEGNWVGLKWLVYKMVAGGSPSNGGVRCVMWVNTSIAADGRPNNSNWRLALDFIDGVDVDVIDPQSYQAPDECDLEIRRSGTDEHDIYAGGLNWRKLSAADITAFQNGGTTPPPPPPPPPTGQPSNIDRFGIKMIYPTKEDGQTWFQTDNPESDGQLISDVETITRTGDYFVAASGSSGTAGAVLLRVITQFGETGALSCSAADSNWSQFASQGSILTSDDWKNVEITILVYPQELDTANGETNDFDFAIQARSANFGSSSPTGCCGNFRYAATLLTTNSGANVGRVRFNKVMTTGNSNRTENFTQTVKTTFYRSWTGYKFIVYNTPGQNANEEWVTLELWLCPSDLAADLTTSWTKVASFIDKGNNWGTVGESCNGTPGQAFTWGTPSISMNYDNIPELRWKKWSVREIDINGEFPTDPGGGGGGGDPDPCEEPEPPTNPPPPPPPTTQVYRFISWGDNDTTTDATDVLDRIFTETNVSQYLFAGDGPYSTNSTTWINMMDDYFSTIELKNKLLLAQGNHEHPESESQTSENQIEAWVDSWGTTYKLNNPDDNLDWLHARKVGNAYIIVMNSQDPAITTVGGDQYNFVQTELVKARSLRTSGQIDWIILMVHKSWFNLLGSNPAYVQARHTYAAMCREAQVDFVFHGHNHSYAIWRPIVAIPGDNENTSADDVFTMGTDGTTYDFSKDHGSFYIINGNGGHEINSWGEDPAEFPNVIYANDEDFGYTVLDIQGTNATITAKDVTGATLFTVSAKRPRATTTALSTLNTSFAAAAEVVLWDSNVEGNWDSGTPRTVTDTEGGQGPDGKGIHTAASGNPVLEIDGAGVGELVCEADSHGRIYVHASNYNSVLTVEFKFNDASILSTTTKLRSRHHFDSEDFDCEDRFGGFGASIHLDEQTGGFQIETCHNEHEPSVEFNLPVTMSAGNWYKYRFTVTNINNDTQVLQRLEMDFNDGQGWRLIGEDTATDPLPHWMDRDSFADSTFWLRNNTGGDDASVSFRNVRLVTYESFTGTDPDPDCPDGEHVDPTTGLCVPDTPDPDPDVDLDPCAPPPPPPPPESIFNDLVIVYNINSDSDGCLCNDSGFIPLEPCPEGQTRNAAGACVDIVEEPPTGEPPTGETNAIYTVRHDAASPDDIRMGDENRISYYKKFGTEILGNDAPVYGVDIKRIEWPMRKQGNPTGTATVVIRKGSDDSIAKTLGTINVQDLTNSFEYKAVENIGSPYITVAGDKILIEYTDGDDNDYIVVRASAEQQNDMKVVKQDHTMSDTSWRYRDQEACFIAYA